MLSTCSAERWTINRFEMDTGMNKPSWGNVQQKREFESEGRGSVLHGELIRGLETGVQVSVGVR